MYKAVALTQDGSITSTITLPLLRNGAKMRGANGRELKIMPLTRDFKETVRARIERDPNFRKALLEEGVECLISGDVETGKSVLRDYINATIGFQELGRLTDKSPKSLMRMFGPNGNPRARNLFEIVGCLQEHENWYLKVHAVRKSASAEPKRQEI